MPYDFSTILEREGKDSIAANRIPIPNAAVREFVGLLTKHRLKQAVILCSMIAVYVLMTFAAYR